MKKVKNIILATFLLFGVTMNAQKIELTPFAGYTFQNKFNISGGKAILRDGATYGITAAFPVGQNNAVELMYSRQETRLEASSYLFQDQEDFIRDVSVNYLMIGGNKILPSVTDDLQFTGGMKIGMAIFDSPSNDFNTITKFAAGLNLGFKYFFSDAIGLRGGMNLNFPITDIGAGIGWSSNGGASVGVSGWSPIVQFAFTGGIAVRLGN
ncbi:hypothetical protein [Owenweeksia hongkongensis]|uniref:hypothetical protein n=1 Tax=Owenweeksia hongkongensis TaxID=253245 RepID=UPI003A9094D2